jgi:hypothetical protein
MRASFTDHSRVAGLGRARNYASRLFDYARRKRFGVHSIALGRLSSKLL